MRLKVLFSILLLLTGTILHAQYQLRVVVDELPAYHPSSDSVFVAGSFNNWNPHDSKTQLTKSHGRLQIILELAAGTYEFKFTKGSWQGGECGPQGMPSQNRIISLTGDTTVHAVIQNWADHFPQKPKPHTATANVHILSDSFFIPQMNRYRRISLYLPQGYNASRKKYPVLYMQDGQNVFDEASSGYGEWGVDEAMDTLGAGEGQMIVVAIDHGGDKRINEYSPYDMDKYGKGEGREYAEFMVHTLKPYIDKHYRTKRGGKYTYIAGSSMGGLISFYALLRYPKVFGAAGVFSPAFWITPQLKNIDRKAAKKVKGKIYFYAGLQEPGTMVPDMLHVFEQMHRYSKAKMQTVIRAGGKHNEAAWRQEFPWFCQWLR